MAAAPDITERTVEALLEEQFPDCARLPVRGVELDGWDNRSFRVGRDLVARLPSAEGYVPQVAKEVTWLPWLAARLSTRIPEIVGVGRPGAGYPFPWTLRRWIPGSPLSAVPLGQQDLREFLVDFLSDLWSLRPEGPAPGPHSAQRGGPVTEWSKDIERTLPRLPSRRERERAARLWRNAVEASPDASVPRWVHGDLAPGNVLAEGGSVVAVIDFGCAAVGDPACDLAICWTDLDEQSRRIVRAALEIPEDLWERGRGWALWKALLTREEPNRATTAARTLRELQVSG